jgi:CDP-diacylglycerol---glycerol-3-phosphate 3-phosphatidyltransferase
MRFFGVKLGIYHKAMGIEGVLFPIVLILVVALSELSDLIDGFIARKMNQVTDLGKLIDPMADSIFRLSVFLSFTIGVVDLPLMMVLILFYRDSFISTLRTICALRGVALAARLSGKIKAVLQAVVVLLILLLMIPYQLGAISLEFLQSFSYWSVFITTLYTVFTALEYVYANRAYLRKALV